MRGSTKKESALQPLSPREIQARVRAGASPEDVAAETGWPLDKVSRYAQPPLGERAYVAELARAVEISRSRGGANLEDSVCDRLGAQPEDVRWDAYRTPEGRWIVTAAWDSAQVGAWVFELVGRTVHPQDESARALMGGGPSVVADMRAESVSHQPESHQPELRQPEPRQPEPHRPEPPTAPAVPEAAEPPRPRLVSVTSDPTANRGEGQPAPAGDLDDARQEALMESADINSGPKRAKRTKTKKGRASVPSWDEILFGASRPQD